jgi:hypothetical protein
LLRLFLSENFGCCCCGGLKTDWRHPEWPLCWAFGHNYFCFLFFSSWYQISLLYQAVLNSSTSIRYPVVPFSSDASSQN